MSEQGSPQGSEGTGGSTDGPSSIPAPSVEVNERETAEVRALSDGPTPWRLGHVVAVVFSCVLLLVYALLPPDPDDDFLGARASTQLDASEEPLEIIDVSPNEPAPGSAIFVRYEDAGARADQRGPLRVFGGKRELETLAERPGLVVAAVPGDAELGKLKVRVSSGEGRSKPHQVMIRPVNWRKKFRNLVGGVALLALAIGLLTHGLRETVGAESSKGLTRVMANRGAALGFGAGIGVISQSTAAVSGLLSGLVTSNALGVAAAGAAFLGAQVGVTLAPGLALGLSEPREGLLVVALAVLWMSVVRGRRAKALSRVVLGAGLIGVALYVLWPGMEPFLGNPAFLSFMAELRADHALGVLKSALLGALLVFVLQGPAPVFLLVLATARTTGHVDVPTALAILSGSGLGSGLAALWTAPVGPRARRLAELAVILGAASTLVAASGVKLWSSLSPAIVRSGLGWPDTGATVIVGFLLSQGVVALLLLPLLTPLCRALDRFRSGGAARPALTPSEVALSVQHGLLDAVVAQKHATEALSRLVLGGERRAGRDCERLLARSARALEVPIATVASRVQQTQRQVGLGSLVGSCLQMQRGLEVLLSRAESLTDERLVASNEPGAPSRLAADEVKVLEGMQVLIKTGLTRLQSCLESGETIELEEARALEIRMNALESTARGGLPAGGTSPETMRVCLAVLAVVDAYEAAGNHVYRMAERLSEPYLLEVPLSPVSGARSVAPPEAAPAKSVS